MKKIRIGGVPEHFNYAWKRCIENEEFENSELEVSWQDFPGGTGALNEALRNNTIDIAVILTEGIVKDIIAGNPSKIAQVFVETPLLWGIHVAADSEYLDLPDLKNTTAAISRPGSGSQLMAYVMAENLGWSTKALKFETVQDIDGAVKALTEDKAQYFMWEKFMTKPLVDKGIFRRIGNCPTPWSSFVIAVRNDFFESEKLAVEKLLQIINKETSGFKNIPNISETLASKFDQKVEDIEEWLTLTEWSQRQLTEKEVDNVQQKLIDLNLIPHKVETDKLLF
ncbi:MAG TPA: substrate-binding domain-containing protein [Salinimicrobium sp.]|nr:substrate-binding domain-containing protein [Salinimicrobium sp.]